jgi:hypothetical protein
MLFEPRSLWDRVAGRGRQRQCLEQLAASGDVRVVQPLLSMVAAADDLAEPLSRAIAHLIRGISPSQLAWLDEQMRPSFMRLASGQSLGPTDRWHPAWFQLSHDTVARLAKVADIDPLVIGLLALHGSGYVRAAALEHLGGLTDGREIPLLALRANDWVSPVAARASELLLQRLRPDNLRAVLAGLPFIARMLGSRRRGHDSLRQALRIVLLSDHEAALARIGQLDTRARRDLHELLATAGATTASRVVMTAAVSDPDAVIRAYALRLLATTPELENVLRSALRDDPVPTVRHVALSLLSEHAPACIPDVLPSALLDRSARVRTLARALIERHDLPLAARDFYIEHLAQLAQLGHLGQLTRTAPGELVVAIAGVGETGTRADLPLLAPFHHADSMRLRRAALRAIAKLDIDAATPVAMAALSDAAAAVRTTAAGILRRQASRVDFEEAYRRMERLADPRSRSRLLPLFLAATKWDAVAYFLTALTDPAEEVRAAASMLLGTWIEHFNVSQVRPTAAQVRRIRAAIDLAGDRLSVKAARLLRFSIESLGSIT